MGLLDKKFEKKSLKRLKEIVIDDFGGNVAAFARTVELSYNMIRWWFSRDIEPENVKLTHIARKIGINPGWLLSGLEPKYMEDIEEVEIPLIQWHAVAKWLGREGTLKATTETIKTRGGIGAGAFGSKVSENYDRMSPVIRPGSVLIIEQGREPTEGNVVFVLIDKEPHFGFYHQIGNEREIQFENRQYPPMRIEKKSQIVGVVVRSMVDWV